LSKRTILLKFLKGICSINAAHDYFHQKTRRRPIISINVISLLTFNKMKIQISKGAKRELLAAKLPKI
jgi:hypothetical protein